MKRRLLTVLVTAVFAISAFGGAALAGQDNQGVPGQPNCFGQHTSFHSSSDLSALAGNPSQIAEEDPRFDSVKERQDFLRGHCGDPSDNAPGQNKK